MRVLFRVDASISIGTGHVARCLTLAAELAKQGADSSFIMRDLPGSMIAAVRSQGFAVTVLAAPPEDGKAEIDPANWLAVPWQVDASETADAIATAGGCDWLIVDHYAVDENWERAARSGAERLMIIDDLANRRHDCDLLLDQNLQVAPDRYGDLISPDTRTLLGPRFALLRPEFAAVRRPSREDSSHVRRLFLFMGGIDLQGFTGRALHEIEAVSPAGLQVDVVIGTANPKAEELKIWCDVRPWVHLHIGSDQMARLMSDADLAIGAGGTTSWERCCVGLPTLIVAVAENQHAGSAALAEAGAALYLGDAEEIAPADFRASILALLGNRWARRHMRAQALAVTDGEGARRVASVLLDGEIVIRRATEQDSENIWRWRNAEETRRFSHDDGEIGYLTHQKWFASVLQSDSRDLLIGETDGEPIGVLRFDVSADDAATISVYLVPGRAGRGEGPRLLRAGLRWLSQARPATRWVDAEVLASNLPSRHAFLAADFVPHAETFRHIFAGKSCPIEQGRS